MGQRFQIIVSTPKVYYNKGNPNNCDRQFWVYHNQWLYGGTALVVAKKIIESIKEALKDKELSCMWDNHLFRAIKYSNVINKGQVVNTHRYNSDSSDYLGDNDWISKYKDWDSFLDCLDNNNGYLFIYVKDDLTIRFCLVNGYEEAEKREIRTPKQYLNLFYSDNDIIEKGQLQWIEALQYLNDLEQLDYNNIKLPKKKKAKLEG
jgi:hypothetical protein